MDEKKFSLKKFNTLNQTYLLAIIGGNTPISIVQGYNSITKGRTHKRNP